MRERRVGIVRRKSVAGGGGRGAWALYDDACFVNRTNCFLISLKAGSNLTYVLSIISCVALRPWSTAACEIAVSSLQADVNEQPCYCQASVKYVIPYSWSSTFM